MLKIVAIGGKARLPPFPGIIDPRKNTKLGRTKSPYIPLFERGTEGDFPFAKGDWGISPIMAPPNVWGYRFKAQPLLLR